MAKNGIVIYSDGGCREGKGGWGIHGFLYSIGEEVKPTNVDSYYATDKGYIDKILFNSIAANEINVKELPPELEDNPTITKVQILHYFEGFGSFNSLVTNNIAELEAAIAGLKYAFDYDVTNVTLIADSNYVIKGIGGFVDRWKQNNWVRKDNTPVPNISYWERLIDARDQLRNRGVSLEFRRMNGHIGHLGNDIADRYATLGVNYSIHGESINQIDTQIPTDKYWKSDVEKHPFICMPRVYFNAINDGTSSEYCLSNITNKADETFGAKISEASYGFVVLEKPDETINRIINHTRNIADGCDSILYMRLDAVYEHFNYSFISKYKERALLQKSLFNMGLSGMDDKPITDEFNPPRLAHRAVTVCSELVSVLKAFEEKDPNFKITDITNKLYAYETITTKKETKIVCKLNKEFVSGVTYFDVEVDSGLVPEPVKIRLSFNIDIPNRNSLKRIEEMNPSVHAITWRESDNSFRYAIIITTEVGAKGIFCGYYSNLRVL